MINLKKGNSISLEKDGRSLENIYVGLNWGKIPKWGGLFHSSVDLDGSVTMFDTNKREVDTVYYRKKCSDDYAVVHSGDDLTGDTWKDDKDNEVISINLKKVSDKVETIFIYLNSFQGHQFHEIPYAKVRLLEGNAKEVKNAFASFNLPSEKSYEGKVSMIMAKIVKENGKWKFITVGDAVEAEGINQIIKLIRHSYL